MTPLWELLALLYRITPAPEVVGKAFTAAVMLAIGLAAAPLGGASKPGRLFAVAMCMVNPWVYDRLYVGHVPLLAAYAAAAWAVRAMLELATAPSLDRSLRLAVASTLVGVFDPRLLYVLALACTAIGAWRLTRPGGASRRTLLLAGLGVAVGVAALSAYWVAPFVTTGATLGRITEGDVRAFTTLGDPTLGAEFNVAALYGFWRRVELGKDSLPLWWLVADAIIALAVAGLVRLWQEPSRRWMAGAIGSMGLLALFIALGVSSALTAPLWRFCFDHVPGFAGLREPQKAAALLVIAYAFAGARGLDWLLEAMRGVRLPRIEALRVSLACLAVALPLIAGWRTFGGAWGALTPMRYPDSWYQAASLLRELNDRDDAVLFLPWHLYTAFDFTGRSVVSNPGPMFFPGRVISGDNAEVGDLPNQSGNPRSTYIEAMLRSRNGITSAGNVLAPLDVRFILLAAAPDTGNYGFLDASADLRVVQRWDNLVLYENLHPVSRVTSVDEAVAVPDLDTVFALARTQSLTTAWLHVDPDSLPPTRLPTTEAAPVPFEVDGRAFRLDPAPGRYVLFADPFHPAWRFEGAPAEPNAAATNVFPSAEAGGALVATGTRLRATSLAVSLGGLATLLAYGLWRLRSPRPPVSLLARLVAPDRESGGFSQPDRRG
ncbi:MAG: hypothetical protein WC211_02045 [Dehalococcoidia bacterium]